MSTTTVGVKEAVTVAASEGKPILSIAIDRLVNVRDSSGAIDVRQSENLLRMWRNECVELEQLSSKHNVTISSFQTVVTRYVWSPLEEEAVFHNVTAMCKLYCRAQHLRVKLDDLKDKKVRGL